MSRLIAFGDVHGEKLKLKKLLSKLDLQENDELVFLGDYIDRGNDSKGVIDIIIDLQKKHKVICLMGNHESFFLETLKYPAGKMADSWMLNGGIACLESYVPMDRWDLKDPVEEMEDIHGDFFANLQLTYETEDFIFVHGYLSHELDVEDQEEFLCLWGRYVDIWPHKSGKTVVCGHSIQRDGPTNGGFKICIDTGSFLPNGYITALVIDGQKSKFIKSCDN
jgi:serine/threonine protein phosphatase 1